MERKFIAAVAVAALLFWAAAPDSFDTIGFSRYITGIYVWIYSCWRAFRKICLDKSFSLS